MFQPLSLIILLVFTSFNFITRQSPADEQSLKLHTDLVLVDVLPVQKKTGRVISDLKKEASQSTKTV